MHAKSRIVRDLPRHTPHWGVRRGRVLSSNPVSPHATLFMIVILEYANF